MAAGGHLLLTGASGYIGGRLLRRFEAGGRPVRCLVRHPGRIAAGRATTDVVTGDCLDEASLDRACAGVQTAYYLVHSMDVGAGFAEVDRRAAANFGRAAARAGVQRIIYLGALTGESTELSTHLKSREETGEVLRASGVPVTELRASIVIGAGSLSFEMIQALVERLPAMVCPRWVATAAQPIAVDDVLAYLEAALDLPPGGDRIFEIGGPQVVSYGDMMREYARLRGLRRLLVPVPLLTPHLSGLWLALVTPAHARIGRSLVEGLRNPTIVHSAAARETFAIAPMPLADALTRAIAEGAPGRLKMDSRSTVVDAPPARAFVPVRRIGGTAGWYFGNPLWRARGWVDTWFGGVGMNRGRSDADACAVGDVIDGWTVEAYEPDRRLRLSADLKLPGRGWLEFEVTPLDGGRRSTLRQTATFDPRGLLGRAYWYAIFPAHEVIFRGLLRQIARRAVADEDPRLTTFDYRSVIAAPADDVFRWHEGPDALRALLPPHGLARVEHATGSVRDGDRVTLSIGVGPIRVRWEARHYGYVQGTQFCDEQLRGPFKVWRHTHRVDATGDGQTLYQDHIEYAVRGGALGRWLARAVVPRLLARAFGRRHQIVRDRVAGPLAAGAGA